MAKLERLQKHKILNRKSIRKHLSLVMSQILTRGSSVLSYQVVKVAKSSLRSTRLGLWLSLNFSNKYFLPTVSLKKLEQGLSTLPLVCNHEWLPLPSQVFLLLRPWRTGTLKNL